MAALLQSLRRSRHLAMALIVLTFLGTSGSWHAEIDDPDCSDGVVAHDHSTHDAQLGRTPSPSAPVHCAICHWLQSFRASATGHTRVQIAHAPQTAGPLIALAPVRSGDPLDLPSRAPPLL